MSDELTPTDSPAPPPGAAAVTPAEVEELRAQAAKANEHWERLLRQAADFENFKKRAARDRQDAVRLANEGLLAKLIPVLDNFDMAMTAASTAQSGTADALKVGVNMIHSQFKSVMGEAGLEELDAAGKPFDPNWQEAVSHQESTEVPEGQVLQQLRKGYKFRDRLLRAATVIVAKQPSAPAPAES